MGSKDYSTSLFYQSSLLFSSLIVRRTSTTLWTEGPLERAEQSGSSSSFPFNSIHSTLPPARGSRLETPITPSPIQSYPILSYPTLPNPAPPHPPKKTPKSKSQCKTNPFPPSNSPPCRFPSSLLPFLLSSSSP